jgi:glycosyltransferase involved in cell wall biosynthesis
LEAFAKASANLRNIQLVIAGGRPEYTNVLKQRAKELGIQEIKFLGYVSPSDLPTLYSAALMLLYPSLYEGFGLPPLEAMACGCPVIVCKTSSLPEVCGDAAYYIDPYDIEGMAEALLVVAKRSDVREGLRQKGLNRVKHFSWEATAQAISRVIESVGRSATS